MAKRKTKRKAQNLSLKQRISMIISVILVFVGGFLFVLGKLGIFTAEDVAVSTGKITKPDKAAVNAETTVHFIDCGQGDSTLIISDGEAMLIDSGDVDGDNRVVKYIQAQGVTELKYVIATHPHADHIGEMKDVLENFKVDKFIMPKVADDVVPTTKVYENMLKQIKKQGLKITKASDTAFTLGKTQVQTFTPKKDYDNLNNYSTIVKITDGDNSFLITGDCENEEEEDLLSQGFDLSAKVLKVAHHGSSTASGADFLNVVLPKYAVISCGEDNKYGHPHKVAVTRLKKYADTLYVTKDNGNVVFSSDGEGLTVSVDKGEAQ